MATRCSAVTSEPSCAGASPTGLCRVDFSRPGGLKSALRGAAMNKPRGPRQGVVAGLVQLTGTPRFAQSIRTRQTNASNAGNYVDNAALRASE